MPPFLPSSFVRGSHGVEIDRSGRLLGLRAAAQRPLSASIFRRVKASKSEAFALVFEPGCVLRRQEALRDGDDPAGKVALVGLPRVAVEGNDAVFETRR